MDLDNRIEKLEKELAALKSEKENGLELYQLAEELHSFTLGVLTDTVWYEEETGTDCWKKSRHALYLGLAKESAIKWQEMFYGATKEQAIHYLRTAIKCLNI
jgi:hypothetical protein